MKNAFRNCASLQEVHFNSTLMRWRNRFFKNEYSNPTYYGQLYIKGECINLKNEALCCKSSIKWCAINQGEYKPDVFYLVPEVFIEKAYNWLKKLEGMSLGTSQVIWDSAYFRVTYVDCEKEYVGW